MKLGPLGPLRLRSLGLLCAAVSISGGMASAQDADRPAAWAISQPRPTASPPITARADATVRDGAVSVGTAAKLVLEQTTGLTPDLNSTLSGSVAFATPGDWRGVETGIRSGFLKWVLADRGGMRTEIGLAGDPRSQTLHTTFESGLPGAVRLDFFAECRRTRAAWGDEQFVLARCVLRRQWSSHLLLQPGVYQVRVHSHDEVQWIGTTLRVEYRGAELIANHEGQRGARGSTRKTWRIASRSLTLGCEVTRRPGRVDCGLAEIGYAQSGLGVSLFPGTSQCAVLLTAGPIQLGTGRRPGLRQTVLGFEGFSISLVQPDTGSPEIGFGFTVGGWLRGVARSPAGWRWQAPLPASAAAEARSRWPGLATLL